MNDKTAAVIKSMRPPFLLLPPICVLLGIGVVVYLHGSVSVWVACWVLVGAVAGHISVNSFNEYFDYASGLDELTQKTPFSGGSGSLPACPQAKNGVLVVSLATLLLTCGIGIYLLTVAGPALLPLGLLGVLLIVAYTSWINRLPVLCLVAPGVGFGPLMVVGTYLCVSANAASQTGIVLASLVSLVPFFLVNNLLLLNQYPDVEADKQVGRKTFPIAYGLAASTRVYLLFVLFSALAIIAMVLLGLSHWITVMALLPLLLLGLNVYRGVQQTAHNLEAMLPYMGKNVGLVLSTNFALAALFFAAAAWG